MRFTLKIEERFLLFTIAVLLVTGVCLYLTLRTNIEDILIEEKGQELSAITTKHAMMSLEPDDFTNPNQDETNQTFSMLYQMINIEGVMRIKVYDRAGKIVYSDEPKLIGKKYPNINLSQAMTGQKIADVEEGVEVENAYEQDYGKYLEIYTPIFMSGSQVGVIELYYNLDELFLKIDKYKNYSLALILFTFLFLFLGEYWSFNSTSKRLEEAHKKELESAERIAKLKDEFVFMAAHELRAPATVIKGYVDLLNSAADSSCKKVMPYVEKIFESNERLIVLINDLLEIARTESGHSSISVKPITLSPIIKDEIERYSQLAKGQKIKIEYLPNEHIPEVMANEDKLKEITSNLITNAIKYGKNGGNVIISHELRNGAVVTHVADDGIGINAEDQKNLFQKFFRCSGSACSVAGTGLGLFITKELIERMDGKIWVTSEPGHGSTFSFKLPPAI
ncbi:HAMP domain-containing histidine kinase [Candidatus Falkowbacteria bacterium]|nr:HAMP domain-containing histidine kinase [Candidatus Falkowbacteria bacterium]